MANQEIKIYTTPQCGYCQLAKDYFRSKGLIYEEYDVVRNVEKRKEMMSKTGQMVVPVISIGGQFIVGFNRSKINQLLGI